MAFLATSFYSILMYVWFMRNQAEFSYPEAQQRLVARWQVCAPAPAAGSLRMTLGCCSAVFGCCGCRLLCALVGAVRSDPCTAHLALRPAPAWPGPARATSLDTHAHHNFINNNKKKPPTHPPARRPCQERMCRKYDLDWEQYCALRRRVQRCSDLLRLHQRLAEERAAAAAAAAGAGAGGAAGEEEGGGGSAEGKEKLS